MSEAVAKTELGIDGEQLVASLLRALPEELASKVLSKLSPDRVTPLRQRMMAASTSPESLRAAFKELLDAQQTVGTAKKAKVAAKPVVVAEPKKTLPLPEEITADPFKALRSLSIDQLLFGLQGEDIFIAAGALACLEATTAAELLKRLPPAARPELTLRLSQPISLRRDIVGCLTRAIVERCRHQSDAGSDDEPVEEDRVGRTATVLRALQRSERLEVYKKLEERDPETALLVGRQLYQFEDLLRVENRSMQQLLADVNVKVLARALVGAPADITAKVQANLSSRARESVADEQSLFENLPADEIENARETMLATMRSMDFEGKLTFDS